MCSTNEWMKEKNAHTLREIPKIQEQIYRTFYEYTLII